MRTYREACKQFQRRYFKMVMRECGQNVTQAARLAGIERKYLHRLLTRLHIRKARVNHVGDWDRPLSRGGAE